MNPFCPNCHILMQVKKCDIILGSKSCPKCKSDRHKPIILTKGKEGLHRCLQCKNEFKPKLRIGRGKYFVCPKCKVKYRCGSEVIQPKQIKSKPEENKILRNIEENRQRKHQKSLPRRFRRGI